MIYVEDRLKRYVKKLNKRIASECYYQFSNVDKFENDITLKIQLPKLLESTGSTVNDLLNKNNYFCTLAVEVDENEEVIDKSNNNVLSESEIEQVIRDIVGTKAKSFGIITNGTKKYRAIKFIIKEKSAKNGKKKAGSINHNCITPFNYSESNCFFCNKQINDHKSDKKVSLYRLIDYGFTHKEGLRYSYD